MRQLGTLKPATVGIITAGVLLFCCGATALVPFIPESDTGSTKDAESTLSATTDGKPSVEVTECEIDNGSERFATAEVTYTFTNNGDISGSWWLDVTILNEEGAQVGHAKEWVMDISGGDSVADSLRVYLDVNEGATCEVSVSHS